MKIKHSLFFISFFVFVISQYSNAQTLDVNTTISSSDPGYPTNPINICLFTSTITTTVTNNNPSAVSGFLLEQSLPGNITVVSPAIINGCNVPFQQSGNVVTYDFTSISIGGNGGSCTITADFIIPCNATPDVNLFYIITNTIPTSPFSINSNNPSFQIAKPNMDFVTNSNGFLEVVDESNIVNTTKKEYALSTGRYRTFDVQVTNGKIGSFYFIYTPEHEIDPIGFEVQGINNGIPTTINFIPTGWSPLSGVTNIFTIGPALITQMFQGVNADPSIIETYQKVRIREIFNVVECSQAPFPDYPTTYEIDWSCPGTTSPQGWCTKTEIFNSWVRASTGGMSASLQSITPPLEICGSTPSEVVIKFQNSNANAGLPSESAMKTLNQIDFSINLDPSIFSSGTVYIESGTTSIDVTTVPTISGTFYTYDNGNHRVTLDFTKIQPGYQMFSNGTLIDGFMPNNKFVEIIANGSFNLRFTNILFNCTGDVFYPQGTPPTSYGFDDCPKPGSGYLFLGKNDDDRVKFYYNNMCQFGDPLILPPDPTSSESELNYSNSFPIIGFAEPEVSDVAEGDPPVSIDYYYQYTGGPNPNPFQFGGQNGLFFNCSSITYQAKLKIPNIYNLIQNDPVKYFPDPNNTTSYVAQVASITPCDQNYLCYIITDPILGDPIGPSGKFEVNVEINAVNCTTNTGGVSTHSIVIEAVCGSCTTCTYVLTCFETQLFHHCDGTCCTPPACEAQTTEDFVFDRISFGWVDEADYIANEPNPTITNSTPYVKLNRVYPCDDIIATSTGGISGITVPPYYGYTLQSLEFEISYESTLMQFFEFNTNFTSLFTYTPTNGTTTSVLITASDLSGDWNIPGACPGGNCKLIVNIPSTAVSALLQPGGTFNIELYLKVKSNIPSSDDFFSLPQIRAQYLTNGSIPSCDPWGDNLTILNIKSDVGWGDIWEAGWAHETPYGWGYSSGICDRRFILNTNVTGGFGIFEDFPAEFRPIIRWPDIIKILIDDDDVDNISLLQLEFNDFRGTDGWTPVQTTETITPTGDKEITFDSYGSYTVIGNSCSTPIYSNLSPWPIKDKNGQSMQNTIRGMFFNNCPPRGNGYTTSNCGPCVNIQDPVVNIGIDFNYINRVYTNDVYSGIPSNINNVCQSTPYPNQIIDDYPRINYDLELTPIINQFPVTSMTTTLEDFELVYTSCKASYHPAWINNVWIKLHSSVTEIDINYITLNGGSPIQAVNGYFPLLTNGNCNATILCNSPNKICRCGQYKIDLNITLKNCLPPNVFDVDIEYGFSCSGFPDINDPLINPPCITETKTIYIEPAISNWAIAVIPGTNQTPTVDPCSTYTYKVELSNIADGDVENPVVIVDLPPGMSIIGQPLCSLFNYNLSNPFVGVVSLTSFTLDPILNVYTWNVNQDVFGNNGMPALHKIEVYFTLKGGCGFGIQNILFEGDGDNICGGDLNIRRVPITINFAGNSQCTDCFTITKTADFNLVFPNQSVTFTIEVCNNNQQPVQATLTDDILAQLPNFVIQSPLNLPPPNYTWPVSPPCQIFAVTGYFTEPGDCPDNVNEAQLQVTGSNTILSDDDCVEVDCILASDYAFHDGDDVQTLITNNSLPPNSLVGATVSISGTFTVNTIYTFTNCTLYMEPGAQIVVSPTITLTLDHTIALACSQMWQGIMTDSDVNIILETATIMDAERGITAVDISTVTSSSSEFINNVVGIYTPPNPNINGNIITLRATRFYQSGALKQGYNGQPAFGSKCLAGLELNNWVGSIGSSVVGTNSFINLHTGIMGFGSNIRIENCNFRQMHNDPFYAQAWGGSAIFSTEEITFAALNIAPANTGNTIDDCDFGIYTDKSDLRVNGIIINQVLSGIYSTNCTSPYRSIVTNNQIYARNRGIEWIMNNGSILMTAQDNLIHMTGNKIGIAINLEESTQGNFANYNISYNYDITLNEGYTGIRARGVGRPYIYGNVINQITNINQPTTDGISLLGCVNSNASCNNIETNYIGGSNAYGIRVSQSTGNNIECNDVLFQQHGVHYSGALCTGTRMLGNLMHNNQIGLYLDQAALINQQPAGQTPPYHGNRWTGTFSSTYGAVNWNAITFNDLLQNRFTTHQNDPAHNPNTPIGTGGWPNNIGWFLQQNSGSTYTCAGSSVCNAMIVPPGGGGDDDTRMRTAQDSTLTADYIDESKAMAKQALYEELTTDPALLSSDTIYQNFKSTHDNSAIGSLYIAKQHFAEINKLDAQTQAGILAADSIMKLISNDIFELDSIAAVDSTSGFNYMPQRVSLIAQLNPQQQIVNNIRQQQHLQDSLKLIDALAANNMTIAVELPHENEKFINQKIAILLSQGADALFIDYSQILQVAIQCPIAGGPSVYRARTLIELYNDTIEYDDAAVCLLAGYNNRNSFIKNKSEVEVIPNPADQYVNILIKNNIEGLCNVKLIDALGKVVDAKQFNCNEKSFKLDISTYEPGIYQIMIHVNDEHNLTTKLVIVR